MSGESVVPELETKRLRLREMTADDLAEWTRLKYADPEMMRYMPVSDLEPAARARKVFATFKDFWAQHGYGAWLVTDRSNGRIFGDCYLEPPEASLSGEVEIGYTIGREYWGRGIATEATRAVIGFAFEHLGLEQITGVVMRDNIGSWRVLEKIGFVFKKRALLYDLEVNVYTISRDQFRPTGQFFDVTDSQA